MKPTRIWLGDPHYVLPLEMWDIFCEKIPEDDPVVIHFTHSDFANISDDMKENLKDVAESDLRMLVCRTAYYQGEYDSLMFKGFTYKIVSGYLIVIPDYMIRNTDAQDKYGIYFDLKYPFEPQCRELSVGIFMYINGEWGNHEGVKQDLMDLINTQSLPYDEMEKPPDVYF